jgi:hypothetical protein
MLIWYIAIKLIKLYNLDCHMENDGRLILTGIIADYSIWDDTIHLYTVKFHDLYGIYPNILLACEITYHKIDLYAQMHPNRIIITGDDGNIETIETSDKSYNGLCNFITEDYDLECCLDFDLPEGSFTLIFDEAPDFDGEPVEKPEEQEKIYTYEKIA